MLRQRTRQKTQGRYATDNATPALDADAVARLERFAKSVIADGHRPRPAPSTRSFAERSLRYNVSRAS